MLIAAEEIRINVAQDIIGMRLAVKATKTNFEGYVMSHFQNLSMHLKPIV